MTTIDENLLTLLVALGPVVGFGIGAYAWWTYDDDKRSDSAHGLFAGVLTLAVVGCLVIVAVSIGVGFVEGLA